MNKKRLKQSGQCGCVIECDRYDVLSLTYCPKHKAAPEMYEALKEIINEARDTDRFREDSITDALAALAKAEGRL